MIEHVGDAKLLTGDTRMTQAEENWLLTSKMSPITREELIALAMRAAEVKAGFDIVAAAGMTVARALRIRELRANWSWRAIASICHSEWDKEAVWQPESNQLAGMALCEAAALQLGEDPARPPWQSVS